MRSTLDLAWLGGLLEGEGAFMSKNGCPQISLQTTDQDVLDRAAALLGTKRQGEGWKAKGKATYKPVYACRVHGTHAISWMMTLYTFLGARRRAKITEIIEAWKASKAAPRASRGTRLMAVCHPDQPRRGNLLCSACWMREWRKRTGRNGAYYRKKAAGVL